MGRSAAQAHPEYKDKLSRTRQSSLLYTAARFGHLDLVKYLVEVPPSLSKPRRIAVTLGPIPSVLQRVGPRERARSHGKWRGAAGLLGCGMLHLVRLPFGCGALALLRRGLCPPPPDGRQGGPLGTKCFFCSGPPQGTTNRQPLTVTNRQPPPTANRQPPPTASGDQPPTAKPLPTATNHQSPTTNRRQPPPTATSHQLPTANRQPPPTANRQPPPTMVEHMSYRRSCWEICV